jgi:hypothetical protein
MLCLSGDHISIDPRPHAPWPTCQCSPVPNTWGIKVVSMMKLRIDLQGEASARRRARRKTGRPEKVVYGAIPLMVSAWIVPRTNSGSCVLIRVDNCDSVKITAGTQCRTVQGITDAIEKKRRLSWTWKDGGNIRTVQWNDWLLDQVLCSDVNITHNMIARKTYDAVREVDEGGSQST